MFFRRAKKIRIENPLKGLVSNGEYRKLNGLQRFEIGKTTLFGHDFLFSDTIGFLHSLHEIFVQNIYAFNAQRDDLFIVDVGANIGLSVCYFKQKHPSSKIVAFEPDPTIYKLLQSNVSSLGFTDVELRNSAAWVEDTELEFFSEGSLAGSTEIDLKEAGEKYVVKAERLKKWLQGKRIDFLKIDIEGAENTLLFDIEEELQNVGVLFVEYHSIAGKEQKLGDILNLLKKAGFRFYIASANEVNNLPFIKKIEKGFDLQLNIFCFKN